MAPGSDHLWASLNQCHISGTEANVIIIATFGVIQRYF